MSIQVRRVVTGHGKDGKSCFIFDGSVDTLLEQPGRGLTFHELWETDGPLADNSGVEDAGARPIRHHPPEGGTRFRIVEFLPDEQQHHDAITKDFETLEAAGIRLADTKSPGMHRNESVDYNIVLSGEIYAVTETSEVLLRAGDVLIQRGTAHTWSNRSGEPCVFASVMVSAAPPARPASPEAEA